MPKKVATALLTILFLPLGAIFSGLVVPFLLAAIIIFSPTLVLGGAVQLSGEITRTIVEKLYSNKGIKKILKRDNNTILISLSLHTLLIPLIVPFIALKAALVTVAVGSLLLPLLAVWAANEIANETIDKLLPNENEFPENEVSLPTLALYKLLQPFIPIFERINQWIRGEEETKKNEFFCNNIPSSLEYNRTFSPYSNPSSSAPRSFFDSQKTKTEEPIEEPVLHSFRP